MPMPNQPQQPNQPANGIPPEGGVTRGIEGILNRVLEILNPYFTTGYAGQAAEAIKKHQKEIEDAMNGGQQGLDQRIMNSVTME